MGKLINTSLIKFFALTLIFLFVFNYSSYALEKPNVKIANYGETQFTINWDDNNTETKIIVIRQAGIKPIPPQKGAQYKPNPIFSTISQNNITGTGNVIVYIGNDAKGSIYISNLPSEKDYFVDFYYNTPENKDNSYTFTAYTLAEKPKKQANSISFKNITSNSVELSWKNGSGSNRIVVIKENDKPEPPKNSNAYSANALFGKGAVTESKSYVVHNGKGNKVIVTNLKPNTKYWVHIYEYNGDNNKANYLIDDAIANPNSRTTLLETPVLLDYHVFSRTAFTPKWKSVEGATFYEIQIAKDKDFKVCLDEYNNTDIGNSTEWEIHDLIPGETYYFRIRAKNNKNYSFYSEPKKVLLNVK